MIGSLKLAKLLRARIIEINKGCKKKVPVKEVAVYKCMIEHYFRVCFNDAVRTGDAVIFPFVGNIQVLEKISKKGYAWDRQYNGKDYELVIHTKKAVNIKTDARWYPMILRAVARGVVYKNEVINHSERLDEILSLMDGGGTAKIRRRSNKITA